MGNVFFYRDVKDTFECDIKVEGTSLSESKVRLLLKFKNRSYIFEGSISKDGRVRVEVPTLTEIQDDSGEAILEVIAEGSYFEAWQSPFDLRKKKQVQVGEVKVSNAKSEVVVENVSAEEPEPKVEPKKKDTIYRENCSDKNKRFIKETFDGFKSLPKKERTKVKRTLREFSPSPMVEKWGKSVFADPDTLYAKLCMMTLQEGMKKVGK